MAGGKSQRAPIPAGEPEVAIAVVVEGALTVGNLADLPVPWWSFTKTLLAAAALVLVEAGRLSLDAALAGRKYSLRQLLQHRAGVPDYFPLKAYPEAIERGDLPWPVEVLLERVSVLRSAEPGTGWLYSNVGYLFVRQLIEEAAGAEIGTAIARLVLAPLGIANAGFANIPADLAGTRWGNARHYHPGWVYHGLMIGPPAVAALALDRLMRGNLLSPATLRAMQNGFRLGGPIPGRPWSAPAYGLGLMIEATNTTPSFIGHSGQDSSSTAAVYHFPARAPVVTAAAFAPVAAEALVEHRVVDIARGLQG